jgi:hypothetical protein
MMEFDLLVAGRQQHPQIESGGARVAAEAMAEHAIAS